MTPQPTPFELVIESLLDNGHEIHFKKEDGTIFMKLDNDQIVAVSGVTLEQIGQLAISSALSMGFKRIDGGDQVEQLRKCEGCGDDYPLDEIRQIERGKNSGFVSCQECYLAMEDK